VSDSVPLLVISGSMGAGKTTVLSEASDLLADAGIPHAAVDLDWLGIVHPPQAGHADALVFANLAAIWPRYREAGARRLIVARVMEKRDDLERYAEAVPGAEIVVCRLTASLEAMQDRLRAREPGLFQVKALARAAELDSILVQSQAEDFVVDNDRGRSITDVARAVLAGAGWLPDRS
jgi:hypothetical protein